MKNNTNYYQNNSNSSYANYSYNNNASSIQHQQIQNHLSKNNNSNNRTVNSNSSNTNRNSNFTNQQYTGNNNNNNNNNANERKTTQYHQYSNVNQPNVNIIQKQISLNDNNNKMNKQIKPQLNHQQSLQDQFFSNNQIQQQQHNHHSQYSNGQHFNGQSHLLVQTASSAPPIFQIKHHQPHFHHQNKPQNNVIVHLPNQNITLVQQNLAANVSTLQPNYTISQAQNIINSDQTEIKENLKLSSSTSSKSISDKYITTVESDKPTENAKNEPSGAPISSLEESHSVNTVTDESNLKIQKSNSISSSEYSQSTSPLPSPSPFSVTNKYDENLLEEEDGEQICSSNDFSPPIEDLFINTKWPLHETWTFWHVKNDSSQLWEANLKEIIDISYVEDFWCVINNLFTMNNYFQQGDVMFFKKGIRPMWEDDQNKDGGSWLHQTNSSNKKSPEFYEYWLDTLLILIGDNFCGGRNNINFEQDPSKSDEHICNFISGVYSCHRGKAQKLSLWTRNYKDEKMTRLIGRIWKWLLKINDNVTINFEAHETKHNKNATYKIVYRE